MKNNGEIRRIDSLCVLAIEDLRRKIKKKWYIDVSFRKGSRALGKRYMLRRPLYYDDIKDLFEKRIRKADGKV